MSKDEELVTVTTFNTSLNKWIGTSYDSFPIYRSKGLLTHLINRKHYIAIKYMDYLPDILNKPDYIGNDKGSIEFVKCYKDNIFLSIKLDTKKSKYYVATMFEVKQSKIDAYVRSGRLIPIDDKV